MPLPLSPALRSRSGQPAPTDGTVLSCSVRRAASALYAAQAGCGHCAETSAESKSFTHYTLANDREGNHKRTFFQVYFHPEFNPWGNEVWVPQLSAQLSIDHQRERASIFQTHKVVSNKPLNDSRWFSVMTLMLYGK